MATTKDNKLSLLALVCIATGNVIGAGIITTTGLAIAETGRSVWISYGLAVIIGFLWIIPGVFWASIAKFKGGAYTSTCACLGQLAGGIYSLWWTPMLLMGGTVGVALGMYLNSVFPFIPITLGGVLLTTVFYVINLFGVKSMSKLQNPTTIFLLICLLAFAVVGMFNLNEGAFQITSSDYYLDGKLGLLDGLMLLVYSTAGHSLVNAFSWQAKRPKRDIPLAIIFSTLIILVLYVSVSFVAGNVLPVEEVAGQPLTFVAQKLFPGPLFYVFIIGGPILALATSANAGYGAMASPILGAARNGWLPMSITKVNKAGVPYIIYTIQYLISVVPMILGVSLSTFTAYTVMTMRINSLIVIASGYTIPTKFKDAWEKSFLHIPNWLYYSIITLAMVTNIIAIFLNLRTLSTTAFIINLVVFAVLAFYAIIRYKAGKTTMTLTYVLDDEDGEGDDDSMSI